MLRMPYRLWEIRIPIDIIANGITFANNLSRFIDSPIISAGTAGMAPPVVGGIDYRTRIIDAILRIAFNVAVMHLETCCSCSC